MTDRLPRIGPGDLDEQQRAVYERITGGARANGTSPFPLAAPDGTLHGPFGVMVYEPVLGSPLERLGAAIRYRTDLSPRVREIAILQVAAAMDSDFEWWAHARVGKVVGLTQLELDALSIGAFSSEDEVENSAAQFCRILLDERRITKGEFVSLGEHLSPATMIELTVLVGYYRTLAQLMSVFDIGVPPDD